MVRFVEHKKDPCLRDMFAVSDYVFCPTHRLPEQHGCTYDHKKMGRLEARAKMINPKRHMGTSLKRIDSDS